MELIKKDISVDRIISNEKNQLMFEGEIKLSDGDADIKSIVSQNADCFFMGCGTDGDRLMLNGSIDIRLVCLDKNDRARGVSCSKSVNESIVVNGLTSSCAPQISCNVSSLECALVNGRKITYKLIAEVGCLVFDTYSTEYVADIEGTDKDNLLFKAEEYTSLETKTPVSFKIKDTLTIGRDRPNIESVIDLCAQTVDICAECIKDNINIKGDLKVTLLYTGQEGDNPLETYADEIEVNGSVPADGAEEGTVCCPYIAIKNLFYNILEDDDGESRVVEIECELCVYPNVFENIKADVLNDAYCRDKLFDITSESIAGFKTVCCNKSLCPIKQPIETDGADMLQIYSAQSRAVIDNVYVADDKTKVEGVAEVCVLYVTGNDADPICSFTGAIPFEHTLETRGSKEGMTAVVYAAPQHTGFNMLSQREIEIRGMIAVNCIIFENTNLDVITDIKQKELPEGYLDSIPGAAVYIVQAGDTLWKLAKKFNTSIADIVKVNDINDPDIIFPGQKLIILKGL